MIPKILTLYWGGRLSFLRYLTVASFKKYHPDWRIILYYPRYYSNTTSWTTGEQSGSYIGEDFFFKLNSIAETIPIDMEDLGFKNSLPEVHKSDIVRLWALSEHGGLYSDMDILFFRSIQFPAGCDLIISYDEDNLKYCKNGTLGFSNGFLGCSSSGKSFYSQLLDIARNTTGKDYQSYGPNLFNNYVQRSDYPDYVWNIPMSLIYHYNSRRIDELLRENSSDLQQFFPNASIG